MRKAELEDKQTGLAAVQTKIGALTNRRADLVAHVNTSCNLDADYILMVARELKQNQKDVDKLTVSKVKKELGVRIAELTIENDNLKIGTLQDMGR